MTQMITGSIPHFVSVARLPQKGMPVRLVANEKELKLLAKAHALESVLSFKAELVVRKWRSDGIKITGSLTARVIQNCIVSLDLIESAVENMIEAILVPENSKLARIPDPATHELLIDFEGPDAPETFTGDEIDVGALAEEFFELAIDPYPRKPGAEFNAVIEIDAPEPEKPSAFAKLVEFRKP